MRLIKFYFIFSDISHNKDDKTVSEPSKLSDSVKDTSLLEGDHINDFCTKIIALNKKDDYFLVFPSWLLQFISNGLESYSPVYDFLIRYNASNYLVFLVVIHSPGHWMLGIVSRFHETIVIMDSMFSYDKDYRPIFQNLTILLQMLANIENKSVDFSSWKFNVATDNDQQKNLYDCGLFVCFNVLGAITNRASMVGHPLFGRAYLKNILDSDINVKIPSMPDYNISIMELYAAQVRYGYTSLTSFYNKIHNLILNPKILCCDNKFIWKISKCKRCKEVYHEHCKNMNDYMCKCEMAM